MRNHSVPLVVRAELLPHAAEEPGSSSVHLSKHLQFKAGEALKEYQEREIILCCVQVLSCSRWGQGLRLISAITSVLAFQRKTIHLGGFKTTALAFSGVRRVI